MTMLRYFVPLFATVAAVAVSAGAQEPALGVWQVPPDAKGQVGHVKIAPCGVALCGTIIRAFGPGGDPITTRNVGKRILWDMQPAGPGAYKSGRVYVPAHDRTYDARMKLRGGRTLSIEGCVGPVCKGQEWMRVQ